MTEKKTEELINTAVKVAIKEYSKEQKEEKKRKALHNTKLLLKSYASIKDSIKEAISEAKQLENPPFDDMDDDDVYIESIRRSKLKSMIVIEHIERSLNKVKEGLEKKRNT